MLAQLIPTAGGPPVTLRSSVTVVGRSAKLCDLVIDHTSVSKMHCILVKTDGLIYMRDLGSTNGTRVNGQRVIRGALLPGDLLSLAGFEYRVHLGPDIPSTAVSPNNATELVPVVPEADVEFERPLPELRPSRKSDSPVRPAGPAGAGGKASPRPLSDSDLLPAD